MKDWVLWITAIANLITAIINYRNGGGRKKEKGTHKRRPRQRRR